MSDKQKQYVTLDGSEAAAWVACAFTEVAAIYPITPSSSMAGDASSPLHAARLFHTDRFL